MRTASLWYAASVALAVVTLEVWKLDASAAAATGAVASLLGLIAAVRTTPLRPAPRQVGPATRVVPSCNP